MSGHPCLPDLPNGEHRLFDAACTGRLDAASRRRLQTLLRESPEARLRYLDYTSLHADLFGVVRAARVHDRLVGLLDQELTIDSSGAPAHTASTRRPRAFLALAIAASLVLAFFARSNEKPAATVASSSTTPESSGIATGRVEESDAAFAAAESLDAALLDPEARDDEFLNDPSQWPGLVARVNRVEAVTWEPGSQQFVASGAIAAGGSIAIASGRIEIEFRQGAVVVLEGPAHLVAEEANAASLLHGKLAAVAPPWATGFRIDTPGVDVVDHGTEFAVNVTRPGVGSTGDAKVNVVVTEGMVEVLANQQAGEGRRLTAGEGVNSTGDAVEAGDDAAARELTEHLPERPEFKNGVVVGDRWGDWTPGVNGEPCRNGPWRYYTNKDGAFGDPAKYVELLWDDPTECYLPADADEKPWFNRFVRVHRDGGHPGKGRDQVWDKLDRYSITGFVVPEDGAYRLEAGWLERKWAQRWDRDAVLDIAVHVNDGPILMRELCNRECFVAFRKALGRLTAGDTIHVGVGPNGVDFNDKFRWGFCVVRETVPLGDESKADEEDLAAIN